MRIALCILTLHRPHGLRSLLEALGGIDAPAAASDIEVIVVDNDPEASAQDAVATAGASLPWPVRYVVEPRRGIPFGRNTAVANAPQADFVAFIDDDELPDRRWLCELVQVQETTGADVVTGTVLPQFDKAPPAWVVRGRFFERPRYRTGTRLDYARTSNVLVRASLLRDPWPPFAESFGLTGGDDTHFFMRLALDSALIVWADDAVVVETVPESRMSASWLVRRAYRRGNTLSLCLRSLRDTWPRRIKRVVASVCHIALGVIVAGTGVVRGRSAVVAGMQRVAFGAGLATGLLGSRYEEYRTIHGH